VRCRFSKGPPGWIAARRTEYVKVWGQNPLQGALACQSPRLGQRRRRFRGAMSEPAMPTLSKSSNQISRIITL